MALLTDYPLGAAHPTKHDMPDACCSCKWRLHCATTVRIREKKKKRVELTVCMGAWSATAEQIPPPTLMRETWRTQQRADTTHATQCMMQTTMPTQPKRAYIHVEQRRCMECLAPLMRCMHQAQKKYMHLAQLHQPNCPKLGWAKAADTVAHKRRGPARHEHQRALGA
jgi:hypothetical protein